ncbi:heavy metal-associated isoprenylated plant protein 3-like [Salvia hispanica]|uniref:heavy metal-associated isoprenylated plant protein 3-like n=1 Tax=Salvia hispanica TaxID=49212 RepID=UPI002008F1EB|nr:heavy metal-associated isoprenylated plant protein 3-like [Salvia hispanica]
MGENEEKVVLKADFHCEGCAKKVIKCIRAFNGVKAATIDGQKMTVTGKVDPVKLQQKVVQKTHQKVEAALTTAVLKLNLHCNGCIKKIYKIVAKTKGYKGVEVDTQKDLVIVSGAVDVEALADELRKHLKKDMAIVPSKKDNGGGDGKGNNVQGNDMHHPHPY